MPVVDVQQDLEQQTITIVAVSAAPVERVRALDADPRRLERVWGPPEWPATFLRHELTPGYRTHYFMTGSDGQRAQGTRVAFVSAFESAEQLQQMLDTGMDEGMREAMAQVDGVLLEPAA